MEASRYINGNCGGAGAHQLAQEKQWKAGGEQFVVEDLLDFSSVEEEDAGGMEGGSGADTGLESAGGNTPSDSSTVTAVDSCSHSFSGVSDTNFADGRFSGDLCEPYDELKELEWLSNFVEESFSTEDLHNQQLLSLTKSNSASSETNSAFTTAAAADEPPSFCSEAAVPGKARSKRPHSAPCIWSSRHLPTTSSSSSESVAASFETPPCKKPAKRKAPSSLAVANGRKCLHCATDKTPQWRAGPMGPKTLCNACGVRYKSGRLVPEYRPAASPTFVLSKHSNSHRKVLELRRQNEVQQQFLHVGGGGFYDVALAAAAAASMGDEFLIHDRLGGSWT